MIQAYCHARKIVDPGVSDAYIITELLPTRRYDLAITLPRSGITTETIGTLKALHGRTSTYLTTTVGSGSATPYTDKEAVLNFAGERPVVQTRFATTALAFMRTSLGEDLAPVIRDCEVVATTDISQVFVIADQFIFLSTTRTYGLVNEAVLKMHEASQFWTEACPAMEYCHGPIPIA